MGGDSSGHVFGSDADGRERVFHPLLSIKGVGAGVDADGRDSDDRSRSSLFSSLSLSPSFAEGEGKVGRGGGGVGGYRWAAVACFRFGLGEWVAGVGIVRNGN